MTDLPTDLLTTKLHAPHPPSGLVDRARLLDRLDGVLERPLALVCAPPGFGKSTLVATWAARHDGPVAWVSADPGDADPRRFWRHVAAALDLAAGTSLLPTVDDHLVCHPESPTEQLVTLLVNRLNDRRESIVLVIDDLHAVEAVAVLDSLAFLLDHRPPAVHLVLLSRADPPIPLARRRAGDQLVEIRERDLRFAPDEAAALLGSLAGVTAPDGAVATLTDRTEGWAAGLQLAGLSLRDHPDPSGFAAAFTGGHRHVLDLLTEEVLDRQPAGRREFLLQTSILDRLSGSLCDAVTGRSDGQATLEQAERDNLFLIPLDDERRWWRYHHLFADLLRVQLARRQGHQEPELHRRAAHWFDQQGQAPDAVRHATSSDDTELAARIVDQHADELLLRGEGASWTWFADLPAELLGTRRLLMAKARLALYDGRPADAEALLDQADEVAGPTDDPSDLEANALLLRSFVAHLRGDAERSTALAAAARDRSAPGATTLRLDASLHLAVAPWLHGDVVTAQERLREGRERWRTEVPEDRAPWTAQYLGDIQLAAGEAETAEQTYREVLDVEAAEPHADPMGLAVGHIGLAQVALRRGELDQARRHVDAGIEACRPFVYSQILASGLAVRAELLQVTGDPDGARVAMDDAVRLGPSAEVIDLLNPVPARRARLLLAQGEVAAAASWIGEHAPTDPSDPELASAFPALAARADLLLVRGQDDAAHDLLDRLRRRADGDGRRGHVAEIDELRTRAAGGALSPNDQLVVPLTERELEILQLIAQGRRNADIGAELYVSLNTVKKHVTHIFDKLGVTSRTAAAARARELGLVVD